MRMARAFVPRGSASGATAVRLLDVHARLWFGGAVEKLHPAQPESTFCCMLYTLWRLGCMCISTFIRMVRIWVLAPRPCLPPPRARTLEQADKSFNCV